MDEIHPAGAINIALYTTMRCIEPLRKYEYESHDMSTIYNSRKLFFERSPIFRELVELLGYDVIETRAVFLELLDLMLMYQSTSTRGVHEYQRLKNSDSIKPIWQRLPPHFRDYKLN